MFREMHGEMAFEAADDRRYACPCCGYNTYKEPVQKSHGFICPVCFWENDRFAKSQEDISEANHGLTLMQAKENYRQFGACAEGMISYVRLPMDAEKQTEEHTEDHAEEHTDAKTDSEDRIMSGGNNMTMDETIKRINELYHKSQAEGLTEEEKEEQQLLRRKYIDSVRGNLRGQLENLSIQRPDGSIEKVKKVSKD